MIRRFATYLHALDEENEVRPSDVLPWRTHRANPYLYSDTEIVGLMDTAASQLLQQRHATVLERIARW